MPTGGVDINLPLPGEFMVSNALAAAATAWVAGVEPDVIKKGLETAESIQGRMQIHQTDTGVSVIDDTYNANPGSMRGAINTLVSLKGSQRAIMVIGDMAELGEYAEQMHADIGAVSARSGIDRLYATGNQAAALARGATTEGMNADRIVVGDKADIIKDIRRHLRPGDWVLIKGSRTMGMEQVVDGIMATTPNNDGGS
jgi:UDP-N-acetylmuramyl pentapeptide synthase